jgi:UDP-N-acetylmuramate dehydrogenase
MKIENNKDLKNLNTLRLTSNSKYFTILEDINQLPLIFDFIKNKKLCYFILGGGSNMILPLKYDGFVIYNRLMGTEKISVENDTVLIKAMTCATDTSD